MSICNPLLLWYDHKWHRIMQEQLATVTCYYSPPVRTLDVKHQGQEKPGITYKKKVDHCEKHIRPDVLLRQHFPIMIARQRKFFDDLQEPC